MKKNLLLIIIGLLFIKMTIISCKKKESESELDKYVGTWTYTSNGGITFFKQDMYYDIHYIDESRSVEITKSGDSSLNIDGKLYMVKDDKLYTNTENIQKTINGYNMLGTAKDSGKIQLNFITIFHQSMGTWTKSNGETGEFIGGKTILLNK